MEDWYNIFNFGTYWHGTSELISITARPQDNLSVKLMAPYMKAPLSTLFPIRSAVMDKLVIKMAEDPAPESKAKYYLMDEHE